MIQNKMAKFDNKTKQYFSNNIIKYITFPK